MRAATMPDPDVVRGDDTYRPTVYTPELGEEFCTRMAEGNCLTRLCKKHKDMPTWKTLQRWLKEVPEFKVAFDLAREALYDYWADEVIDIADTTQEGEVREDGPLGTKITTSDMLGHRKLQLDARKWLLSKLARGKFGDKVDLNVAGQPGGAPIQSVSSLTTDPVEAASVYQQMLKNTKK